MPKVDVYDMTGAVVDTIELSDDIFGVDPNPFVLHEMVKHHLAARRQGTQSALTRAEVSGGGRKPWRQKGTGHARQGSTRAVQWTHGGIAFAPKPRDYRFTVNRKVRRLALKSALSQRVAEGAFYVVDNLQMEEIKTKNFVKFLKAMPVQGKTLVVTPAADEKVYKSARNIPGVKASHAGVLNVYDLMDARLVLMDKEAVRRLEEVYHEVAL